MHLVGVCIHMYVAGLLKEGLHLDAAPDLPANELIQPLLLPQSGERVHILYVEVQKDRTMCDLVSMYLSWSLAFLTRTADRTEREL